MHERAESGGIEVSFHVQIQRDPASPLAVSPNNSKFRKLTNTYPSEILDRRLYLGDHFHCKDFSVLHNLGITHILNVSDKIPSHYAGDKVSRLPLN